MTMTIDEYARLRDAQIGDIVDYAGRKVRVVYMPVVAHVDSDKCPAREADTCESCPIDGQDCDTVEPYKTCTERQSVFRVVEG